MNVVMVAMTTLFEHHLEMAFIGPLNTTSINACKMVWELTNDGQAKKS